ncbi:MULTISPECIES: hypothetical protein [unclassified Nonomuraea]|uniref:hypothetical protein n=1 Tax=unclassified Nonomuraea TaxID=2593643 RepID=UPI001F23BFA7|nr:MULTISPECIES: hypothetical protein [unclassified Nonomuraea]
MPQWLRLRADPGYHESYLEFLPKFFSVRPDPGDFPFVVEGTYFETGHLWFVVLLLTFSLVLAPLARWVPRGRALRRRERLVALSQPRGAILLLGLPIAAICALARLEEAFGGWDRWAYLAFFLYGFLLVTDPRFRAAMRRTRWIAAVAGAVPMLVGVNRLSAYLAPAVLPLYILHQPIVVAVAFHVAGWQAAILVEYVVIVALSLGLTVAVYDVLVRRTRVTRFLFGMWEPTGR